MTWKRWRHCWLLLDNGKRVGQVVCVARWGGGKSLFYASLQRGPRILPLHHELGDEGSFYRLYDAKKAVLCEYDVWKQNLETAHS